MLDWTGHGPDAWGDGKAIRVTIGDGYRRQVDGGYRLRPGAEDEITSLVQDLKSRSRIPTAVVAFLGDAAARVPPSNQGLERELDLGVRTFFHLCRALVKASAGAGIRFLVTHENRGGEPSPAQAALASFFRTVAEEHPAFSFLLLEIEAQAKLPPEVLARELAAMGPGAADVAYREGQRLVRELEPFEPPVDFASPPPILRPGGTYLITGGGGGLGRIVARYLAKTLAANLVLTGRSSEGDPEALAELQALTRVRYVQADVADESQMRRVCQQVAGPVHGIFHCAGLILDRLFYLKPPADLEAVLRPKVQGSWVLEQVFGQKSLDFIVFFSSITALKGNPGQSDYAFANGFMDGPDGGRSRTPLPTLVRELAPVAGRWYGAGGGQPRAVDRAHRHPTFERGAGPRSVGDVAGGGGAQAVAGHR